MVPVSKSCLSPLASALACLSLSLTTATGVMAQELERVGLLIQPITNAPPTTFSVATVDLNAVRTWDRTIRSLVRAGELRTQIVETNTMLEGHTHERLTQYYRGVPVAGGGVIREMVANVTVSVSGTLYSGISVQTVPTFTLDDLIATVIETLVPQYGDRLLDGPDLVIRPDGHGSYALAYDVEVWSVRDADVIRYLVDAHTGEIIDKYSNLKTQIRRTTGAGKDGVTALGVGEKGDTKKLSVTDQSGGNVSVTKDSQRAVTIKTFDGAYKELDDDHMVTLYLGIRPGDDSDLASNASGTTWLDTGVVDAHAYLGWAYDYLYERFNRRGLDDNNGDIPALVHWPHPRYYLDAPRLFCNANYYNGRIYIGDGLPAAWAEYFGVEGCPPFTQAFGVVAHELAHGVTDFTSDLIYARESGALNEAFSDIIGTSSEFFHAEKGSGLPYQANYQVGDEIDPENPIRDMANPASIYYWSTLEAASYPSHYGSRWLVNDSVGLSEQDNGWVHINSSIVNHAFYLAIEGGEAWRSSMTVQGVGASNRSDVEEAYYQAFSYHLTPNAKMRDARYWTIEKAPTSASRVAIAAAWDAVGVHANQQVVIGLSDFNFSSDACEDYDFGFRVAELA